MTALVALVHAGDVAALGRLLAADPAIASARIGGTQAERTPLHVVADWPGFFAEGPQLVRMLVEAGADPNARFPGEDHGETPLHWAASSDDADVASALIDAGADVDAPGGSIGTPLENAVGYGCWHVARLLVARGARVETLWVAAALGLLSRITALLPAREPAAISQAFWHACAGGQRRAAELLLAHGADVNWIPSYANQTPLDAVRDLGTQRTQLATWLAERGARPA